MTGANQISLRDIDEKFIEMNLDISLISIKKFHVADNYFMKKFSGKLLWIKILLVYIDLHPVCYSKCFH